MSQIRACLSLRYYLRQGTVSDVLTKTWTVLCGEQIRTSVEPVSVTMLLSVIWHFLLRYDGGSALRNTGRGAFWTECTAVERDPWIGRLGEYIVADLVSILWQTWWIHCGRLGDHIVADLVSTLWQTWWVHCSRLGEYMVADLVSTLWQTWWVHCGRLCEYILADFVIILWQTWWVHCGRLGEYIVSDLVSTLCQTWWVYSGRLGEYIVVDLVSILW